MRLYRKVGLGRRKCLIDVVNLINIVDGGAHGAGGADVSMDRITLTLPIDRLFCEMFVSKGLVCDFR